MTSDLPALLRAAAARIEELEGEHAQRKQSLAIRARELCTDPEVWQMRQYPRHVRARHGVMRQLRAEGHGYSEIARAIGVHHTTVMYACGENGR